MRRPQNDLDIGKRVCFRVFVRAAQYQNPFCPQEKFLGGRRGLFEKSPLHVLPSTNQNLNGFFEKFLKGVENLAKMCYTLL